MEYDSAAAVLREAEARAARAAKATARSPRQAAERRRYSPLPTAACRRDRRQPPASTQAKVSQFIANAETHGWSSTTRIARQHREIAAKLRDEDNGLQPGRCGPASV